jgi:hypothetical protein
MQFMKSPHPTHFDTLGMCYASMGDFERAAEQSRTALESTTTGPWASLHRDRLRDYARKRVPWPVEKR